MPMPVSATSKRTRWPRRVGSPSVTRTVISPSAVNLTALETRLVSICWRRKRSPTTRSGARRSMKARSSSPLPRALLGQQLDGGVDRLGEVELGVLELELAGLDLRQVEDVVDDRQQRVARESDHATRSRAARRSGRCRAAARPSRSRRSSACAAHGSWWPGTATSSAVASSASSRAAASATTVARARWMKRPIGMPMVASSSRSCSSGSLELVAVELHRAEAAVAGDDRQADGAREPGRGDRRRARRGGARHQRLGPHRLAGVRHAHRQVLERERRRPSRAASPLNARWRQLAAGRQLARVRRRPATACRPASRGWRRAPRAAAARPARRVAACASTRVTSWRAASSCWPRACSVMSWNWTKNSVGQPSSSVSAVALTSIQRGSPLAGDDPALRLVGADLAGQHALEQALARRPLLGMDGVGERAAGAAAASVRPGQLAERGVDLAEAPVGADHRHAGRRVRRTRCTKRCCASCSARSVCLRSVSRWRCRRCRRARRPGR